MKKTFEVEVNENDYNLLAQYGYFFERNIEEMLKDHADQLKQCLKEDKKQLTLEYLNNLIDKALLEGQKRRGAMHQTNILNAEFALGKYFALLNIIDEVYGIDEMIKAKERTQAAIDELTGIANEIY